MQMLLGGAPGVADLKGAVVDRNSGQFAERAVVSAVQRGERLGRRSAVGEPRKIRTGVNDFFFVNVLRVDAERNEILRDGLVFQIERRTALVGNRRRPVVLPRTGEPAVCAVNADKNTEFA